MLTTFAAVEHGVDELLQGPVKPESPLIQSWPDTSSFTPLNGEPTLTVVPDLMLTEILTIMAAAPFGIWAVVFAHRPRGYPVAGWC